MFNLAKIKPLFCRFLPSPRFWLKSWWGKPVVVLVLAVGLMVMLSLLKTALMKSPTLAEEYLWPALAWILEAVSSFLGQILLWIIDFLIQISSYNDFLNARVVSIGWSLTRDVANMFYILVMLIIAFGTMFKLEQYSWKKLLPRLILTAILVNFSKTIIGLFIDFAQVIMLTFVNGYAAAAGGNFMSMFNIKQLFESTQTVQTEGIAFSALLGFLLGTIMLGVAVIVVGVFVLILLCRIITLWILIVLAPLAFLLGTFPKGQEYYADWWKRLENQIIVGPVIAFFLWLSLAALGGGDNQAQVNYVPGGAQKEVFQGETKIGTGTEAGDWGPMASFAVSIAMLFVALQMTQNLAGAAGGLAGTAMGWMKSQATGLAKKAAVGVTWKLPGRISEAPRKQMWLTLSKAPSWTGLKMIGARRAGAIEAGRVARAEQKIKGVQYLPLKDQMRLAETWKPTISPTNKIARAAMLEKMISNPAFSTQARKEWTGGETDPQKARQAVAKRVSAVLNDYAKLAGTDEKKMKQIFDFKKENPDLVHPLSEKIKTVRSIKVDEITKVDDQAFLDPEIVEAMDDKQRHRLEEKGNRKQKDNCRAAKENKKTAEQIFSEEELKDPKGEKPGHEEYPVFIQQKIDANLDRLVSIPPDMFSVLRPDQKFKALSSDRIKVGEIEAGDLTANSGELAGQIATNGSDELIDSAVKDKPVAFRSGLMPQIQQTETELNNLRQIPNPTPEDTNRIGELEGGVAKLRKAATAASSNPQEAFEAADYNPVNDTFATPQGQEAFVKLIQSAEPPSWLKDLKVEAIFKKDPNTGVIQNLKNLGAVLGRSSSINNLLKLAHEATTREQKRLVSALMLAKKEKIPVNELPELSRTFKTPAFEPFLKEMRSLENELHPQP